MADDSAITEEMRQAIGQELRRLEFDIEKTMMRRFVESIEDPNPRWKDIVPPSLFVALFTEGGLVKYPFEVPFNRIVDGGGEWEFFQTVRIGDAITAIMSLSEIKQKEGKSGPMLLLSRETKWINQRDEVVAKNQATQINY